MAHSCQFCERTFSRTFNRDRHEKQGCHDRLMQNQEESNSQDTISEDHSQCTFVQANADEEHIGNLSHHDKEQEDEYGDNYDAEGNDDKNESDEDDDDDDEDDGNDTDDDEEDENTDSDNENGDSDPWDKLREEAIRDMNSVWEEHVEEHMIQGLPKENAASSCL